MKKRTKKIIKIITFLIVFFSILLLFVSGYILGPDRRWVEPLESEKIAGSQ